MKCFFLCLVLTVVFLETQAVWADIISIPPPKVVYEWKKPYDENKEIVVKGIWDLDEKAWRLQPRIITVLQKYPTTKVVGYFCS